MLQDLEQMGSPLTAHVGHFFILGVFPEILGVPFWGFPFFCATTIYRHSGRAMLQVWNAGGERLCSLPSENLGSHPVKAMT